MIRKWMYFGALASLALAQVSSAEEFDKPLASISATTLTGKITCHGVSAVQMTADQEQSLPLHVIGTLNCGDEVTVLSDSEGYTINIRTADGKSGYVARMYLALAAPGARKAKEVASVSTVENGVARWQAGQAGSDQFMSEGRLVESLTANGVTVQVSLQDTGWKLRANVAIANAGQENIYVLPRLLTLSEITGTSSKVLAFQDPAHMATALNHQILGTSAVAGPDLVTQSQRSSSENAGTFAVAYKTPVYSPNSSPNYLMQHQLAEEQARKNNRAALLNNAREIKALALTESTVKPSEKVAGSVWFERNSKSQALVMRVPVGNTIFEFPLSFNDE